MKFVRIRGRVVPMKDKGDKPSDTKIDRPSTVTKVASGAAAGGVAGFVGKFILPYAGDILGKAGQKTSNIASASFSKIHPALRYGNEISKIATMWKSSPNIALKAKKVAEFTVKAKAQYALSAISKANSSAFGKATDYLFKGSYYLKNHPGKVGAGLGVGAAALYLYNKGNK